MRNRNSRTAKRGLGTSVRFGPVGNIDTILTETLRALEVRKGQGSHKALCQLHQLRLALLVGHPVLVGLDGFLLVGLLVVWLWASSSSASSART